MKFTCAGLLTDIIVNSRNSNQLIVTLYYFSSQVVGVHQCEMLDVSLIAPADDEDGDEETVSDNDDIDNH